MWLTDKCVGVIVYIIWHQNRAIHHAWECGDCGEWMVEGATVRELNGLAYPMRLSKMCVCDYLDGAENTRRRYNYGWWRAQDFGCVLLVRLPSYSMRCWTSFPSFTSFYALLARAITETGLTGTNGIECHSHACLFALTIHNGYKINSNKLSYLPLIELFEGDKIVGFGQIAIHFNRCACGSVRYQFIWRLNMDDIQPSYCN